MYESLTTGRVSCSKCDHGAIALNYAEWLEDAREGKIPGQNEFWKPSDVIPLAESIRSVDMKLTIGFKAADLYQSILADAANGESPRASLWHVHCNLGVLMHDLLSILKTADDGVGDRLSAVFPTVTIDLDRAVYHLLEATKLGPLQARAWYNLGWVMDDVGNADLAMSAYEAVLRIDPSNLSARYNLAALSEAEGKVAIAEAHFSKLSTFTNSHIGDQARWRLVLLLWFTQRHSEAEEHMKYLHHNGFLERELFGSSDGETADVETISFILASLSDESDPLRQHVASAPTPYIRRLFDGCAPIYDMQLKNLGYVAPQVVAKTLGQILEPEEKLELVLDLGCGTGSVGAELLSLGLVAERTVIGVDVSRMMLFLAEKEAAYRDLYQSSMVEWVAEWPKSCLDCQPFQVVAAADVLIYVGDLFPIFKALESSSSLLAPGARFVFTTEVCAEREVGDGQGVVLRRSGRFAHSQSYITRLAHQFGWNIDLLEEILLRFENGVPLAGHLWVLSKPTKRSEG